MRWFCLSLLLLNGFYAIWNVYTIKPEQKKLPVSAVMQPDGGSPLRLIEELNKEERAKLFGEAIPERAALQIKPPPLCKYIGPFNLIEGEKFITRMSALEILATLKTVSVDREKEYMLYLAPEQSRDKALQKLNELQAKQIDSFVITEGELNRGISLGLFKQKEMADSLKESLIKRGFPAQMKELVKQEKELWARFEGNSSELLSHELWQKVSKKKPELQLREIQCGKELN